MEEMEAKFGGLRCPDCESAHMEECIEDDEFEYGAGDKKAVLRVRIPVHHCADCGLSLMDERAADIRHEAVCRHLNLLTPSEIRALRAKLGLSQAAFAELSGVGVASVARWESGHLLQSRSNDSLLRLLNFGDNVQRLEQLNRRMEAEKAGIPIPPEKQRVWRFKGRALDEHKAEALRSSSNRFELRAA